MVVVIVVAVRVLWLFPVFDDLPALELAEKRADVETRHIERRHQRREDANCVKRRAQPSWPNERLHAQAITIRKGGNRRLDERGVGPQQDLVLREEAAGEREPDDRRPGRG